MNKIFAAFLFLSSAPVFATVVNVTVPIPTVGEGLYLCNAGVSHLRPASSTATPCVDGGECPDEAVMDPARGNDGVSYQVLERDGTLRRYAITAPKNGTYAMISPLNSGWAKAITGLSIGLSSETYGAKYFLEFCYQGPIVQVVNKQDVSLGIYQLQASLFANTANYISSVSLTSRMSWSCDLRAVGSQRGARAAAELMPQVFETDATQSVVSSLGNISKAAVSFTHTLNSNTSRVPRFCVMRLEFAENAAGPRTSNAKVTEFTTDLNFFKSNF